MSESSKLQSGVLHWKKKPGLWNGEVANMSQSPCGFLTHWKFSKIKSSMVVEVEHGVIWDWPAQGGGDLSRSCYLLFTRHVFFWIRVNMRSSVFAYFICFTFVSFCDQKGTSVEHECLFGKKKKKFAILNLFEGCAIFCTQLYIQQTDKMNWTNKKRCKKQK